MSDIQETVDYLNKILPIVEKEIDNVNIEIKEQENKINQLTNQLKDVTQQITDIEQQETQVQDKLKEYQTERVSLETKINDLENEISSDQEEADKLQKQIDSYNEMINKIGEFDPLAAELIGLVNKLKGTWDSIINKINTKRDHVHSCKQSLYDDEKSEQELDMKIQVAMAKKETLLGLQNQCDSTAKQLGRDKTVAENFLISLKQFKSKADSLVDSIKLGKEFKDPSILSKQSIQDEIKNIYKTYNRTIPSELLD